MPKVLLSSVYRPFGGPGEGDSVGAELFHAQVTRAQGIFSFRQVIRCWALDYIAANIEAPTVVLHYPSEREFIREIKLNSYDYVGISFVVATFHKVRRMARLVRRFSPGTKIILGGYGTVLPDVLLQPFADYICREEGIAYMQRLLGEKELGRTIRHPYAPIPAPSVYSISKPTLVGHLTAGLGCPNGCDFCCTSHFFKRRYIPFLETGTEIYQAICRIEEQGKAEGKRITSFILIDEDFFLNEQRARDFLGCARAGGRPLSLMGFGSVRGLSQFTADEIAEMGFDTIWTAFEGLESGYSKLQGSSLTDLYADLKARGIALLSSMIIGFPYQNEQQIRREFDTLMELEPAMSQILIYFAFPGTPLHRQVLQEGRYLPEYRQNPDLRRFDGFSLHFKHPHFNAAALEALQRELYRLEFERLGPSVQRVLRVCLDGYRSLRDSANPLLRERAHRKWLTVINSSPALVPALLFGPSAEKRAEARVLLGEIWREADGISIKTILACLATPLFAGWTLVLLRAGLLQQPKGLRVSHRTAEASLQNLRSNRSSAAMLIEDVKYKASAFLGRFFHSEREEEFLAARVIVQSEDLAAMPNKVGKNESLLQPEDETTEINESFG